MMPTGAPPSLRPLITADLPLVRQWMQDAPQAPAWSEAELRQLTSGAPHQGRRVRAAWAAQDANGVLTGFVVAAALRLPDAMAECELEFLLVVPPARRSGVGRALLEQVLRWTRELQAPEIWLEVRASNAAAQSLYRQCGFESTGRRPAYYVDPTEDAVSMRRRIAELSADAPL